MSSSRRLIGGLVRLCLVFLAIYFVGRRFTHNSPKADKIRIQTEAPPPSDKLGPGDMRIYNADSSIDVVLMGDKVLAGLSPKTVAIVKSGLDSSASEDTSGLGASISKIVKQSVAGAIGTHAVYPVADVHNLRFDNDQLVFDGTDGKEHKLFSNTKVNGRKASNTFRAEDAERFIAAVNARRAGTPK